MRRRGPSCLAAALALLAGVPSSVRGGVGDSPLPTFSDGKPAVLAALIPAVVKNNNLETTVICTNLAAATVDVGLEVFDEAGTRGNTIATGNGAVLSAAPGQTVTIATGRTAVLHEDAVLTLEAPVTGLRNGSGRVVATSAQVGCVALAVDKLHTIQDPGVCPTCQPPSLGTLPLSAACSAGACDDGNACTVDACDDTGACIHTPVSGCSTTTTSSTIRPASTTTTSTTTTTLPTAGDQLISSKKLLLKASPADPARSVAKVLSKDLTLTLGGGNLSVDDPTLGGGSLRIMTSAGDLFDDTYDLPSTNWSYVGALGANAGYRYKDRLMSGGPITLVVVQHGKLKAVGKGSLLGHSLGADPNPVQVVVRTGAKRYCASFGGTTSFTMDRRYIARDAAAPSACPR